MKANSGYFILFLCCLGLVQLSQQLAADLRQKIEEIETSVRAPFMIDVILLGATTSTFNIKPSHLSSLLADLQSTYSPTIMDSKQALALNYSLTYNVKSVDNANEYEALLRQHLVKVQSADPMRSSEHEIDTEHLTKYFTQLCDIYSQDPVKPEMRVYTIFVVHVDKRNIIASEPDLQYHYKVANQGPAASVWIGPGRWLVIDLSSGPARPYGPLESSTGTVGMHSLPSPMLDAESVADHVAALCLSALKHVLIPDLEYLVTRDDNKVIIPLIVFRDHNAFDPWEDLTRGIDLSQIRRQVSKMFLHGQEVQLFPALHSLHAHKHVSVALYKSLRALNDYHADQQGLFKVATRTYLDGVSLLHELKSVPDLLAEGLLGDIVDLKQLMPDLKLPGKSESLSKGIRILPVYIFSLKNAEPNLLLDNGALYDATSDGVVVLQTEQRNISVPYFSDNHVTTQDGLNTVKNIIAGLSIALGGVTDPTKHYSRIREGLVEDYLWAVGYHPYGPFAHSDHLSDIFSDAVIRNHLTSKLHAAIHNVRKIIEEVDIFAKVYLSIDDRKLITWEDLLSHPGNKPIEVFNKKLLSFFESIDNHLKLSTGYLQHYDLAMASPIAESAYQASVLGLASVRNDLMQLSLTIECCAQRTPNKARGMPWLELARGLLFALIVFVVVRVLAARRKLRPWDVEFKRKKEQ
eukprot:TRINITY_DN4242_c0_g1_i1.p1 TRINITY_DN4242_c0_g1~~TRINITY_DN4242_c0_g1_i1.p1  ORF type:complete len:691 (+),score=188.86 TRINITY_DN4242_c0_g1_i1:62-2134(+)